MKDKKHRDEVLCKKILSELSDIEKFTSGLSLEGFVADTMIQKAVVMSFINIGELANAFSDEFISQNNHFPLKEIRGFRNIAAHKYGQINMKTVWLTVENSLPKLKKDLADLL